MERCAIDEIFEMLDASSLEEDVKTKLPNASQIAEIKAKITQDFEKSVNLLKTFPQSSEIVSKIEIFFAKVQLGEMAIDSLKSIQEQSGISNEELIAVYERALEEFAQERFDNVIMLASLLGTINPDISTFWRLMGSCYWRLEQKENALTPFLYASLIDSVDVTNHLATLECLIALGKEQEALNFYQTAKEILTDLKQFDDIAQLDCIIKKM